MRQSFIDDLRSITSGEFSEEVPFKVKNLAGDILLDGADFDPPWSLIFEQQWVEVQPDGTGVEKREPRALVHLQDINGELDLPLSDQNILEINGENYPVTSGEIRDDANGMAYVALRKEL